MFVCLFQFAVLEFPSEESNAVVPTKWTFTDDKNELRCYWFPPKWSAQKRTEAVMRLAPVTEDFELLDDTVIIHSTHGKYPAELFFFSNGVNNKKTEASVLVSKNLS